MVAAQFSVDAPLGLRLEYSCCVNLPFNISDLLPVTAAVAIGVFAVRELLEHGRRKKTKARQIKAVKHILSRECELNFAPLRGLKEIFEYIEADPQNHKKVAVVQRSWGPAVEFDHSYGFNILPFSRERMSDMFLDVAALDDTLFKALETAYDSVGEVDNARDQLVRIEDLVRETRITELVRGLSGYGLARIEEADAALQALYKDCTGKKLERGRLRG
jgi:hypothetical protein